MRRIFVDAGFWIALLLRTDRNHGVAGAALRANWNSPLVTTEPVLGEALNGVSAAGPVVRAAGAALVDELRRSTRHVIVDQSHELFDRALELYRSRSDQKWGLVDCSSFLVTRDLGITEAFAFDRDFEQAGFVVLPARG